MATTGVNSHRRGERLAAECYGVLAGWGTLLAPRAARRQERLRLRVQTAPAPGPGGTSLPGRCQNPAKWLWPENFRARQRQKRPKWSWPGKASTPGRRKSRESRPGGVLQHAGKTKKPEIPSCRRAGDTLGPSGLGMTKEIPGQTRNEGKSRPAKGRIRARGGGGLWGCRVGRGIWRWCGGRLCSRGRRDRPPVRRR